MEGAIKVIQQEQVEETSSRTSVKAIDLYHFGKMGSIVDINTTISNYFYCLMNIILITDEASTPSVWTEIVKFDFHENNRRPPLVCIARQHKRALVSTLSKK
jgi:hypothetical protein